MNNSRLKYLFQKHLQDSLEGEELLEFYQALEEVNLETFNSLTTECSTSTEESLFDSENLYNAIDKRMDEQEGLRPPPSTNTANSILRHPYLHIAAAILLITMSTYFVVQYQKQDIVGSSLAQIDSNAEAHLLDSLRLEGSNILFADGKELDMEDLQKDTLHYQGLAIVRTRENELSISKSAGAIADLNQDWHQFVAKAGSTLRLTLPDKSVVQLNSGSRISFASGFARNNRAVKLQGEAYFEVSHNKELPFEVAVKDANIQVLGTVFNISGYEKDKLIKTTLLSGSVAVNTIQSQVLIKPGQQAQINNSAAITILPKVDLRKELAWREGMFRFKDESIQEICAELSKWYFIKDLDIPPGLGDKFTGSIKRTKQLEDVLAALAEVSDLKIVVQEGRVVVMK